MPYCRPIRSVPFILILAVTCNLTSYTSWREFANLNEARSACLNLHQSTDKSVTVQTLDGCTYFLWQWRQDTSSNIVGEGAKRIRSQGNEVNYLPFSGMIPADSIALQKEILILTKGGSEYQLDEWGNQATGDFVGKGHQILHAQIHQFDEVQSVDLRNPFEGTIRADSIATVKFSMYDAGATRTAILVTFGVGIVAVLIYMADRVSHIGDGIGIFPPPPRN